MSKKAKNFIDRAINNTLTIAQKKALYKVKNKIKKALKEATQKKSVYLLIVNRFNDLKDPRIILVGVFDTEEKAWQHAKKEGYLTRPKKNSGVSVQPLDYWN